MATPESTEASGFSIYPNPSDGHFNLKTSSEGQVTISIKIFNVLGQEIFRTDFYQEEKINVHPIQISAIQAGIYLIMFIAKEKNSPEEFHFTGKIHVVN